MGKNLDPTGAVPEEDASGSLSLTETNTNFALAALGTFILSCIALGSVFFWYAYLYRNGAPQITNVKLRDYGFIGIATIPVLPFLFLNLLYPPSLVMNNDGIAARNWGRTKRLVWSDIQAINLVRVRVNRNGNTKTRTTIKGGTTRISFMPLFGVAPAALADYINYRRNKSSPGLDIAIGNQPLGQNLPVILGGLAAGAVVAAFVVLLKSHGIH